MAKEVSTLARKSHFCFIHWKIWDITGDSPRAKTFFQRCYPKDMLKSMMDVTLGARKIKNPPKNKSEFVMTVDISREVLNHELSSICLTIEKYDRIKCKWIRDRVVPLESYDNTCQKYNKFEINWTEDEWLRLMNDKDQMLYPDGSVNIRTSLSFSKSH